MASIYFLVLIINYMFFTINIPPTEARFFKRHTVYGAGYKLAQQGYKTMQVPSTVVCAGYCTTGPDCIAFQIGPADSQGESECQHYRAFHLFNGSTTHISSGYAFFVQYFEAGTEPYLIGMSADRSVVACKHLPAFSPSGVYWIDPDSGSHGNAFQAYCDMDTAGGGWTLVYSYTFTAYNSFQSLSNAVTPIPNWPLVLPVDLVPKSTNPPLGENQYGAVDFSFWHFLGNGFLVKSNINHWVKCQPILGNLVTMTPGSINCTQVKSVTGEASCATMLSDPTELHLVSNGIGIFFEHSKSPYGGLYFWEGSTTQNWPTHDPCGLDTTSFVKGLLEPRGSIFIK